MARNKIICLKDNNKWLEDQEAEPKKNVFDVKNVNYLCKEVGDKKISDLSKIDSKVVFFQDILSGNKNDECIFTTKSIIDDETGKVKIRLYTGNLLGFIGFKDQLLKITSRFDSSEKDFFVQYMLSKTYDIHLINGLDFTKSNTANSLDLLCLLFPHALKKSIRVGLFKQYKKFEYNDSKIRGTLDVARHIRRNSPFVNGRFAYNTNEFSRDNSLMQLIRHTIEFLEKRKTSRGILLSDHEVREAIDKIKLYTPFYSLLDREVIIRKNSKTIVHPYFMPYKQLQQLCKDILKHKNISYGESDNKIYGLLFDGALLWENYVAMILRSIFVHYTNNSKNFYLLNQAEDKSKKKLWIIPDFVGRDKDQNIIGDAKYIPLDKSENIDASRAGDIYYKTVMYMYRFNSNLGFLFFPCVADESEALQRTQHFLIEDRDDSHLYQIGFRIPKYDANTTYSEFCSNMKTEEDSFRNEIRQILDNINKS